MTNSRHLQIDAAQDDRARQRMSPVVFSRPRYAVYQTVWDPIDDLVDELIYQPILLYVQRETR